MTAAKPPLIAHVIFRFGVGGLENGLVNLVNRIPPDRYRHAVVCIDKRTDFAERLERDDVEIVSIGKKPGTDPGALWRLHAAFRSMRPDIVHTRNLGALDALLPARIAGARVRIHGEHGWDVNDLHGRNRKLQLLRRLHAPLVNHYIALSKEQEQYLIEKVRVPPEKVTQLYNGVDTAAFRPESTDTQARRDVARALGADSVVLGTVGRLEAVKNQATLVEAFVQLLNERPDRRSRVGLAIVGDGASRPRLEEKVRSAGIEDRVWFAGNRNDVAALLQQMDVFVLPSLAEGISNTILEAMASGLPVVATRVGGNPELVLDGETGTLVAPAEADELASALQLYVDDDGRRRSHGAAGRRRAEQEFDIASMVENYLAVYDRQLQLAGGMRT